jgi:predicted esterase
MKNKIRILQQPTTYVCRAVYCLLTVCYVYQNGVCANLNEEIVKKYAQQSKDFEIASLIGNNKGEAWEEHPSSEELKRKAKEIKEIDIASDVEKVKQEIRRKRSAMIKNKLALIKKAETFLKFEGIFSHLSGKKLCDEIDAYLANLNETGPEGYEESKKAYLASYKEWQVELQEKKRLTTLRNKKIRDYAQYAFALGNSFDNLKDTIDIGKYEIEYDYFLNTGTNMAPKFQKQKSKLNFYTYCPKSADPNKKFPCLVFIHGGDARKSCNNNEDNSEACYLADPKSDSPDTLADPHNFSPRLLPFIRSLVENECAVVTLEYNGEDGKADIKQQIKNQIEKLKEQNIKIDTEKMFLMGHSFGGYIVSHFVKSEQEWLNQNFIAVGIYAPLASELYSNDQFRSLTPYFVSTLGDRTKWIKAQFDAIKAIEEIPENGFVKDKDKRMLSGINALANLSSFSSDELMNLYLYLYPFSDLSNAFEVPPKREDLSLDVLKKPVYLFQGDCDLNTLPNTQMQTIVNALSKSKFKNWKLFLYKNASHSIHRIYSIFDTCNTLCHKEGEMKGTHVIPDNAFMAEREKSFVSFVKRIWHILKSDKQPNGQVETVLEPGMTFPELTSENQEIKIHQENLRTDAINEATVSLQKAAEVTTEAAVSLP